MDTRLTPQPDQAIPRPPTVNGSALPPRAVPVDESLAQLPHGAGNRVKPVHTVPYGRAPRASDNLPWAAALLGLLTFLLVRGSLTDDGNVTLVPAR